MRSRARRSIGSVTALAVGLALLAGCGSGTGDGGKQQVVRVPADAATITEALTKVSDNGLVLISPGVYREAVTVEVPGVTLRGTDRNQVVIDSEGVRPSSVLVTADGVTVQNLTVKGATFYGLLVTGMPGGGTGRTDGGYTKLDPDKFPPVQRFRVDHVTANNNGLYGIYAFDAQHGIIENSYASGSADSGFYVGQCRQCDITVRGNVAERNAVGFENANASDSVYVVGNRWSGNRVGMTMISSYQEAFVPQRGNTVAGNVIVDNTAADSPAQANGGFGIGVGVSGGQDNVFTKNLITGNPQAGVLINNAEDIPAKGNKITDNKLSGNGVDVADSSTSQGPSSGNCVQGSPQPSVLPASLAKARCPTGSAAAAGVDADKLPAVTVPPGVSFLKVAVGPQQPNLTGDLDKVGGALPATVGAPDTAGISVPPADLLVANTGTK